MAFSDIVSIPNILLLLVLISVGGSVAYIGLSAGNPDTRDEIQRHVSILLVVNLLTTIFLGFLLYYYLLSSPASFFPFTIFIMMFNMFLGIMAVSISILQKMS